VLEEIRAGRFSIHGRYVSFRQDEDLHVLRRSTFTAATRTLVPLRRTAYRWQRRLERRGLTTPRALARVARRLFS
jgi:hypothetical protein